MAASTGKAECWGCLMQVDLVGASGRVKARLITIYESECDFGPVGGFSAGVSAI